MNCKSIIIKVIIVFLAITIFSACSMIKPVSVTSVGNFKTVNPLFKPEIRFDLGLYNPNNFAVNIEKMEIGLYMGGPALGKITILEETSITKKESILVPLSISPSMSEISGLLDSGLGALLSGNADQLPEIKGEVVIRKFIFRKKYQIKESIKL